MAGNLKSLQLLCDGFHGDVTRAGHLSCAVSRPTDTQLQLLNCISHQDDQLDTKSDSTNKISAEICSALDMEGRGGPTVGRRYLRVREPPGLSLPPSLADLIEFGDRRRADGRLPMGPTRYALLHNSSSQVGSRDFTIRLGPAGSLASLKLTCSRPKRASMISAHAS